ncbi:Fimbrin N-terminal actin-Crosslinking domain, partial [Cladochytrium replicatum]
HFWSETETAAYVEWINSQLSDDPELGAYLPVSKAGTGLFQACRDGVLLSKLVNKSVPFTIDENRINKKPKSPIHMSENLQKVLNGARAIGCQVHNLGPEDIKNAVPHLCLGLIWQVIKVSEGYNLDIPVPQKRCALDRIIVQGNTASKNEKVLLMWFNLRLEESECPKKANNFGNDLSDSVCLSYLVNHLSPDNLKLQFNIGEVLSETNLSRRAELMLQAAERIGCRQFTSPADIVAGNKNLNMAFVAVLYTAEVEPEFCF